LSNPHQEACPRTMAEKIYRRDVDGLRAIAILLVLVFHFNLFDLGKAGFLGVDIFFVISGYLISGLIWRGLNGQAFSLKSFYVRRLRRLAPALLVTQLLMMVVAAIWFMPHELATAARENLATSLYASNFYYWRSLDYFGLQASQTVLLHTWSLAIEEQFYLLYPLLLIAIHRYARPYFLLILTGLVLLSFGANLLIVGSKPWAAFYLLPTRAWELGIGALIPFAEPRFAARGAWRSAAAIAGLILIAAGVALFTPATVFPGSFALLPTLGAALIILAGSGEGSMVSRILATRAPVALGQISYSLYLVHWPLRTMGERLLPTYGLTERWSLLAASLILATLIYHAVENPVRQGRLLRSTKMALIFIVGGALVMIAVSAATISTGGWPQRFAPRVVALAAADLDIDPDQDRWEQENKRSPTANFHPIGDPSRAPTWIIVGDSHAAALSGAADIWLKGRHEAGLIGYRSGCLPVLQAGDPDCRAFNAGVQDKIRAEPNVRNVLLISIWRQAIGETLLDHADPNGPAFRGAARLFEKRLVATLDAYKQSHVGVHIWEPLPSARRFVPAALGRTAAFGDHWPIARTRAEHDQSFAFFKDILDRNQALIASRVDPAASLCNAQHCAVQHDGRSLYSDNNHPAWSASPYFARLFPQ
jgi:peptidoglycan/LPS O-acetylase OafA/YrhL